MARKRNSPGNEEQLLARITEWDCSYYLGKHVGYAFVDDEAVTRISGEIVEIDDRHKQLIGMDIEISLVCARRFHEGDQPDEPTRPLLFDISISKRNRSLLSYLPADAYWALPSLLSGEPESVVEIAFERLHRGSGEIRSVWIGSYAELLRARSAIAERLRAT